MKTFGIRLATFLATLSFLAVASADAPASKQSQARYETRFLTMMIDHHNMAIEMASLCEGRTVHPELQQMCENIITAQQAEIVMMQSWLNDWYGVQHDPVMKPKDERMLARLAALSGEDFEVAF